MGKTNDLIAAAKKMAADNRNVYGKYPNNMGPYTWDCATFLSKCCYDAGICSGKWHDLGYFWPHISEAGFDYFLTTVCKMTKLTYIGDGMLVPGDILISRESYGHTAMFLGNWKMIEAHDQYPADQQIGIHDWKEMDWCFVYRIEGGYEEEKVDPDSCSVDLWILSEDKSCAEKWNMPTYAFQVLINKKFSKHGYNLEENGIFDSRTAQVAMEFNSYHGNAEAGKTVNKKSWEQLLWYKE